MELNTEDRGGPASACPSWCRRGHHAHDHGADSLHQSDPVFLPVVTGDPRFTSGHHLFADDVVIRVIQRPGSPTAWLEVASEEGRGFHVLVSTDSAHRLVAAVAEALQAL